MKDLFFSWEQKTFLRNTKKSIADLILLGFISLFWYLLYCNNPNDFYRMITLFFNGCFIIKYFLIKFDKDI